MNTAAVLQNRVAGALPARIVAEHAAVAARLSAAVVEPERREAALTLIEQAGLPTARDENWRYASLRSLEKARFAPVLTIAADAEARVAALLPQQIAGFDRYVFVDGVLSARLSAPIGERAGVNVVSGATSARSTDTLGGDARFAALNAAFANDAIEITAADARRGVELLFLADAQSASASSYPRVRVHVAPGTRFALIERHISDAQSASFVNAVMSIALAANASLDHYRLQALGATSTHLETVDAELARDSCYALHAVSLGAQAARSTLRVRLAGEAARFDYGQVVATDGSQVNDTYALVEHLAPRTETREAFRGIAAGRSRVAFNGRIVMERAAVQANSAQTLRSLLAGAGAEANVRPQLEIYTDDVKASHGATAGKLDEQMLFYLLSRGIERETAQSLLKWAFLAEVIARIDVPQLRSQLEHALAQGFRGSDADIAKELL